MIRRRKKRVPIISDSSEDENPQPRKYFRSTKRHNLQSADSNVLLKNSRRRQIERRENNGWSSDSSSIQRPRKRVKNKLPIITSEESSSSEDEELVHPTRRGALRELSDYETGYGSEKTSDTSPGHFNDIEYREGSTKSDIVIPKREVDMPASNTSGLPSYRLPTLSTVLSKRMRIVSSDEESDHRPIRPKKSHTSNMINRNNVRNLRRDLDNRGTAHYSDRPSTSGNSSPIQQRANRSQRASSSMSILTAVSDEQTPTVTIQNSLSNDGENTSTLSNNDSDDTLPLKKPGRRGAHVPLPESDEDVPHDPSTCKEKSLNSSSDESECCPICFMHFTSQEIGTPASCNHCFCVFCIQEWAKNNNTCPVDRKLFNSIIVRSYNSHDVVRVIPVENVTPVIPVDEEWNVVLLNNDSDGDSSWTEEDSYNSSDYDGPDEACCICFQWGTNDNIIACDNCLEVYHLACLDPPLSHIPAEDWYCPDCEKDDTSTEESSSESSSE